MTLPHLAFLRSTPDKGQQSHHSRDRLPLRKHHLSHHVLRQTSPSLTRFAFLVYLSSVLFPPSSSFPSVHAHLFRDVSVRAGLLRDRGRCLKYGGASIADLDGDGWPDLLLGHHGHCPAEVYFNAGNDTFFRSSTVLYGDNHALSPVRLRTRDRRLHFLLSRGGWNGLRLSAPYVFNVGDGGERESVTDVTWRSPRLVAKGRGRGRSVLFLSLRTTPAHRVRPDMLVLSAQLKHDPTSELHSAFETLQNNKFMHRWIPRALRKNRSHYATVTDIDGDGQVEVLLLSDLSVWALTADFRLTDVSRTVLPGQYPATAAVAELDVDNDGRFDLAVARAAEHDLEWWARSRRASGFADALLLNVGGRRYEDLTITAGFPRGLSSCGVTAADFDNDGWVDLFLVQFDKSFDGVGMVLLMNNGNGTFRKVDHGVRRDDMTPGDTAVAVDYNLDGRVDLIVSEGDWGNRAKGGYYRILQNMIPAAFQNAYLLVRVLNAPESSTTSLHATVKLTTYDGLKMLRRIGSPGTAVSVSFVETVHFGVGARGSVKSVKVTWVNGRSATLRDVSTNQRISIGSAP